MSIREYPAVMLHQKLHFGEGFYITRVEQEAGMSHPIWIGADFVPGVYPLCAPIQPETEVRILAPNAEVIHDVGWAESWPLKYWNEVGGPWGWMTVLAMSDGVRYSLNPNEGYRIRFEYGESPRYVGKGSYIFLASDGTINGKPRPKETLVKVTSAAAEVEGKCVIFTVEKQDD